MLMAFFFYMVASGRTVAVGARKAREWERLFSRPTTQTIARTYPIGSDRIRSASNARVALCIVFLFHSSERASAGKSQVRMSLALPLSTDARKLLLLLPRANRREEPQKSESIDCEADLMSGAAAAAVATLRAARATGSPRRYGSISELAAQVCALSLCEAQCMRTTNMPQPMMRATGVWPPTRERERAIELFHWAIMAQFRAISDDFSCCASATRAPLKRIPPQLHATSIVAMSAPLSAGNR